MAKQPAFVPQFSVPVSRDVDALIDLIDRNLFPSKTASETDTLAQMHRYAGQRSVVDLLRSLQVERDERTAELTQK